jgi:hypothetical protein
MWYDNEEVAVEVEKVEVFVIDIFYSYQLKLFRWLQLL